MLPVGEYKHDKIRVSNAMRESLKLRGFFLVFLSEDILIEYIRMHIEDNRQTRKCCSNPYFLSQTGRVTESP